MLGASFLPARFRNDHSHASATNPGYLSRQITPLLQSISQRAFNHPIRTIAFVALLASTSYVSLLEGSLFDHTSVPGDVTGGADLNLLVENGKRLVLGDETAWRWQVQNEIFNQTSAQELAVFTLVFPDSRSSALPRTAPLANEIPISDFNAARLLPSTSNPLSPISKDSTLVFSVLLKEAFDFLDFIRELPNSLSLQDEFPDNLRRTTVWVIKASKSDGNWSQNTLARWAYDAWTNFVDLLKVRGVFCLVSSLPNETSVECGIT